MLVSGCMHAVVCKRNLGGLFGWVLIALEEFTTWQGIYTGLDPLGCQLSRSVCAYCPLGIACVYGTVCGRQTPWTYLGSPLSSKSWPRGSTFPTVFPGFSWPICVESRSLWVKPSCFMLTLRPLWCNSTAIAYQIPMAPCSRDLWLVEWLSATRHSIAQAHSINSLFIFYGFP